MLMPDIRAVPQILCTIDDHDLAMRPGSGSQYNILPLKVARKIGYRVDKNGAQEFKTVCGSTFKSIGTTMVPLSFTEENEIYPTTFHVVKSGISKALLGNSFLQSTSTLTEFKHRIKHVMRASKCLPSLNFVSGEQDEFFGSISQKSRVAAWEAMAVPDTGTDASFISEQYAMQHGMEIDRSSEHHHPFQLPDGTVVHPVGAVRGCKWRFSGDHHSYTVDFLVLRACSVDIIFGHKFVLGMDMYAQRAEHGCINTIEKEPVHHKVKEAVKRAVTRGRNKKPKQGDDNQVKMQELQDAVTKRRLECRDRDAAAAVSSSDATQGQSQQ